MFIIRNYIFSFLNMSHQKREGFCQLLQQMKNKHSEKPEPDMIDLQYVFSKYVEAWFFLLKPTEQTLLTVILVWKQFQFNVSSVSGLNLNYNICFYRLNQGFCYAAFESGNNEYLIYTHHSKNPRCPRSPFETGYVIQVWHFFVIETPAFTQLGRFRMEGLWCRGADWGGGPGDGHWTV